MTSPARTSLLLGLLIFALVSDTRAQAPAAAPPKPPPGWTGSFGAGLALTGGNTDTSTVNLAYDALRDYGTKVLFKSAGLYLRGDSNGEATVDRAAADARVDYKLSSRLSAFGMTTFARDKFKAIDYILAPTGGLAYKVVSTSRTEWTTDGSVGVVFEKDHGLDLDTAGALIAGEKLVHKFTDTTRFLHGASALWKMNDFADAYYTVSAGVVVSLAAHLDLKAEFLESYKNRPSNPALKKSDQAIVVSAIFKY